MSSWKDWFRPTRGTAFEQRYLEATKVRNLDLEFTPNFTGLEEVIPLD